MGEPSETETLTKEILAPKGRAFIRPGPVTTKDYIELISCMEHILGPDYALDLLQKSEGGIVFSKDPNCHPKFTRFIRTSVGSSVDSETSENFEGTKSVYEGCTFPRISSTPFETLTKWKQDIRKQIEIFESNAKNSSQLPGVGNVIFYDRHEKTSITKVVATFEIMPKKTVIVTENETKEANVWMFGEIKAFCAAMREIYFYVPTKSVLESMKKASQYAKAFLEDKNKKEGIKKFMEKNDLVIPERTNVCCNPSCIFENNCSSDVLKRCSRCRSVLYCCVACQTQHWPQHKQVCKPM